MQFLFLILYGALVGSFLNAVIDRLHTGESIKTNRSHCDSCGHVLGVFDLIPVFSWMILRGRCRYCSAAIPIRNPLVELTTIGLFVATYLYLGGLERLVGFGDWIVLGLLLTVVCSLLVLFVYDVYHQLLPDRVMLVTLVATIALHGVSFITTGNLFGGITWHNAILSGIGSALPYFVIILLTKGAGMGGGDLKLAFVMGLLLGFPRVFFAHYIAFLLGGMVALLLLIGGKKRFGQSIAFGPFLVIGTYLLLFWGDRIAALADRFFMIR